MRDIHPFGKDRKMSHLGWKSEKSRTHKHLSSAPTLLKKHQSQPPPTTHHAVVANHDVLSPHSHSPSEQQSSS
jgi:hypothetical protein